MSIDLQALGGWAAAIGAVATGAWAWWLKNRRQTAETVADVAASKSETVLFEQLTRRIQDLEARQAVLEQRIAEEIKLRLKAQEETITLRVHVQRLEAEIVKLGGSVPTMPRMAMQ